MDGIEIIIKAIAFQSIFSGLYNIMCVELLFLSLRMKQFYFKGREERNKLLLKPGRVQQWRPTRNAREYPICQLRLYSHISWYPTWFISMYEGRLI